MIAEIQRTGGDALSKKDHDRFMNAAQEGTFVEARVSGHVLAAAALRASKDLTGQYLRWNDEKLSNCARQ